MLNQRRVLLCILGVLFVFYMSSTGFAESDQKSDSALSESQYIMLIQEIRELDTKMAERIRELDTKMAERIGAQNTKMAEKLGELETKMREHVDKKLSDVNDEIKELQEDVAFMKGMFTTIQGITTIFGGPLLVGIALAMIVNYIQNRRNKTKVDTENNVRQSTEALVSDEDMEPIDVLIQDKITESDSV